MKAGDSNRPSPTANRLGARLNACKHNLFTRTDCSTGASLRVQQLRDVYNSEAVTQQELAYHCELAEVQAHIEDIRRVQQTLWQEMLEAAGLDRACDPGPRLSSDDGSGNTSCNDFDPGAGSACPAGNDRLDQLTRKLLSLAGYQRRAAGRRRRLVLDILRDRAQRPAR